MYQNLILLRSLLTGIFTLWIFPIQAQQYTISGTVEDATTGEAIVYGNVYDGNTLEGTITNYYGFYSLTLGHGTVNLTVSYVGYNTKSITLNLTKDTSINVALSPVIEMEEVVITGESARSVVKSTQMGMVELPVIQVKKLPALLGEVDIIKSLQLMPGVQSGTEGTSGIYVRGGGPDQNLILLDGVPVYNANHLFGFFSVFNADAIQNVSLIKGGFPARYGGRLSSVIDIKMKEGNNREFKGEGSVGLISSKLTLEGPIVNENTSFIVSGRRTYIDILSWPIQKAIAEREDYDGLTGYYFYDLNAKINHKFSDKSRLYLSAYMGEDRFYLRYKNTYSYNNTEVFDKQKVGLDWGNIITALRWNYTFGPRLFANFTGTYSRYKFSINNDSYWEERTNGQTLYDDYYYEYFSGIKDLAGKIDFDFIPNPNHYVRFGYSNTYHTFHPGVNVYQESIRQENTNTSIDTTFGNQDIYAHEMAAYVEDEIKIGNKLKINAGVHYSNFFVKDEQYHSFQPRISARYLINNNLSLKASHVYMKQYIHLLTSTTIGLPTDLWVPVTDKILPQEAAQTALGAAFNLSNTYEFTIEGFYKDMNNLIEYKEGASFFSLSDDWEDKIEIGKGWSYGMEFMVQKKVGKISGWIGYTLSWSERKFENISFGKVFPYKFDRRHDLSLVLTYQLNENVDFGLSWVYGTGVATTLPEEKYLSGLSTNYNVTRAMNYNEDPNMYYYDFIEHFETRNSFRMPAYHRLDYSINFHKKKKWGKRTFSFGVYNGYNRKNPFYLFIDYDWDNYDNSEKKVVRQLSLFPVIPFVRYSFTF